jgi:putative redox protein
MIAHSEWKHDEVFEGTTENGNTIMFDADAANKLGPGPLQAVLMALCCCTSVDVVSIL